jgi:ribosomal protein S18 acetylase RimI-like enzyme
MEFSVRAVDERDQEWIGKFILDRWHAEFVVVHGVVYYPHKLRGFVAEVGGTTHAGLVTYVVENSACELVTLDSVQEGVGIGSALVQAVAQEAAHAGCSRVWCITTNDNHPALRFYQKRGFKIAAVRPGAVDRSRVLKPSIPLLGVNGIPIRDEIELELRLPPTLSR